MIGAEPDSPEPRENAGPYLDSAHMARQSQNADDWVGCIRDVHDLFRKRLPPDCGGSVHVMPGTTLAVRRVLDCLRPHLRTGLATLLTTDDEYPGIVAALDEFWPGPMFVARTSDFVWHGRHAHLREFLEECVRITQPQVLYLSHVTRGAGFKYPDDLFALIRRVLPMAVIIVDGAQSFCNVDLRQVSLFKHIDVFVTSGHKFSGGTTYTGLVWVNEDFSSVIQDPAVGYTRSRGSGSTGDYQALSSLRIALVNLKDDVDGISFAEAVRDKMSETQRREHLVVGDTDYMSGIVTLWKLTDEQIRQLRTKLGNDFTLLFSEQWRDPTQGIRRERKAHCLHADKPGDADGWTLKYQEYAVEEERACAVADLRPKVVRLSYPPSEDCCAGLTYQEIATLIADCLV